MNIPKKLLFLSWITALAAIPLAHANDADPGEPPVTAPFLKKEDSLCVNDWQNRPANPIINLKVPRDKVIGFGIYTVSNKILKLSAQLYPLYPKETREVRLEIESDGAWKEIARQNVNDLGWSTTFRVEKWDDSKDIKYRLRHGENAVFEGLVRAVPRGKDEIVVAALSCNSNKDRGLRPEYTRNINHQDPDLVFFAGDQSYDHTEHTAAWLKFGLAFREIFRTRPCITIPDGIAYANPNPKRLRIMSWEKKDAAELPPKEGWADGWGLIRFKKPSQEVTFECWPRFADVTKPGAEQFPGWPQTVQLRKRGADAD